MLRHYLVVVLRNIVKNKVYAGINLMGLALGMAAFLVIITYVRTEHSYDRGHVNGERIYRVESLFLKGEQKTDHWATSTNGYAPAMRESFPEVEAYTRINWNNSTRVVRYQDVKFREEHVCFVDSNFFTFFSYPVLRGDPATFLTAPNTVVISETAARTYFGTADPIGKYLDISTINSTLHCSVTGVFKNLPPTSTMQFDLLMSWNTSSPRVRNHWYQHGSYTFVRLRPGTNPDALEARFPALAERYKTETALRDHTWAIDLVPLEAIHLNPAKPHELEAKGNRSAVQFLTAMGLVILVIAWVNYINLSLTRAMNRAKEVSIRKVLGSYRSSLLFQFLFESLLLNAMALALALVLALAVVKFLPAYLGLQGLQSPLLVWAQPQLYMAVPVLFLAGTLLSGVYPAAVLANIEPVAALKGKHRFAAGGGLRKGLVILQFCTSLILVVGTFVVYRQLSFMMQKNLGVAIDQVVVLEAPVKTEHYYEKIESFKNELRALPGVTTVSGSGAVPGKEVAKYLANRRLHDGPEADHLYEMLTVDYDFIPAYKLQVVAGRGFDRNRPLDQYGLVLNETAVRQFGFTSNEQAIGEKVLLEANPGRPNEIIGVIKDYHQQSLQQQFKPTILFMDPDFRWIPTEYYSLNVTSRNPAGLMDRVQEVWNKFFPESSLDFFFLDDFFNRQYQQDRQFGRTFLIFSLLAIFIACLGLFGLTSYSTARRTKEIGVRKVLGATIRSIMALLIWDTLKLLLVASVLAAPASWYVMRQWLAGYAFRIGLNWVHWVVPIAGLVLIALATIGYITLQAACANPSRSLRSE